MRVTDTIHIDAPVEVVWAVTVDLERWPEWTPTMTSVSRLDGGPLEVGSRARIKQPMQPIAEWLVTELAENRRFAWGTGRRGVHITATHELVPEGATIKNVVHADAEGALARLLWPLLRIALRRALVQENRGLKRRCESESALRRSS